MSRLLLILILTACTPQFYETIGAIGDKHQETERRKHQREVYGLNPDFGGKYYKTNEKE